MLADACTFLWTAQSEDGGWHSETHAIMRDGESLTPFILSALMQVPDAVYPKSQGNAEKAIDFIRNSVRSHIDEKAIPQVLDYPNYTAAYALKVLHRHGNASDSVLVEYLRDYLIAQQFVEHRGIDTTHAAFGGWGFGERELQYGTAGHVDISHTRRVLEALALVLPKRHVVFLKAQAYLARVQNDYARGDTLPYEILDGGFFTSIVTPATNKSMRVSESIWRSYATATCDGLLALSASGVTSTDPRLIQAAEWLEKHKEMQYPEGIPLDDPLQWHRVMKYYHLAVRTETCQFRRCDPQMREKIISILRKEQRKDGSFMNPVGGPNKEDDPLLATALAVIAMRE